MQETFGSLLRDPAHWEFEIFLILVFDVLLAGVFYPFLRKHWKHHLNRDRAQAKENIRQMAVFPVMPPNTNMNLLPCSHPKSCEVLVFYDRPGSPPGNGWGCSMCIALREKNPPKPLLGDGYID